MFNLFSVLIKYQLRGGVVIGYDKNTGFEDSDILHPFHVEHVFTSSKFKQ